MDSFQPKVIQDVGEVPLTLYSDVREPLGQLSFLRRSLVMAELAMIAYNDQDEAGRAAAAIGFPEARLIENDGAQAYWFRNEFDVVLTCRGTQPNEWNDIQADVNAIMAALGAVGRVHSGFYDEVKVLWPTLEEMLREAAEPVWFCGHSLGGAMATICAFQCKTSSIVRDPQELHTFGSPRVGCRRYVRHVPITHFRWVHNNDIVTRMPPLFMGYRHGGHEVYFDRNGRIRPLQGIWRSRDRWRGLLRGFGKWRLDMLTDHGIRQYAANLVKAVEEELQNVSRGGKPLHPRDLAILDVNEDIKPNANG